jgi:isocitrate lyase
MLAYSQLQQREFEAQSQGFTTVKHQSEVGVQYFDAISDALGASSTTALQHSTENEQF